MPLVLRGVDNEPRWRRMLAEVEESPWWETFVMWTFLWNRIIGASVLCIHLIRAGMY